jgi:hypothetical protein
MKRFFMALALIGAMVVPAHAEKIYERSFGVWSVEGFVEPNDRYCIANTFWPDNTRMQINAFFNRETPYLTLTFRDPTFYMDVNDTNVYENAVFSYIHLDDTMTKQNAQWQVKDVDRIIFRNLTEAFLVEFARARTMFIDIGGSPYVAVDLTGTADVLEAMVICKQAVTQ